MAHVPVPPDSAFKNSPFFFLELSILSTVFWYDLRIKRDYFPIQL
jgi:hypothetical protein